MLVRREVFAMQEMAEESIEELIEKQGKFLGHGLFLENEDLKTSVEQGLVSDEVKNCWKENMIANFIETNAEMISFNTEAIVFEKDVPVDKMNETGYLEAAITYMEMELGKISDSRMNEYRKFIEKTISLYSSVIHFKIVKIGSHCYSFFILKS